eukprot:NODE_27_length_39007_cov_1.590650.p11 type:complete len:395 gc:universal NODE_27_length_39007_cov_1.590650:33563-34747(+)
MIDIHSANECIIIYTTLQSYTDANVNLIDLFQISCTKVISAAKISDVSRMKYFASIIKCEVDKFSASQSRSISAIIPPKTIDTHKNYSDDEILMMRENDEFVLRELRIALRSITIEICKDKQYKMFIKPVNPMEYEDYYSEIAHPLCLADVMNKIDEGGYLTIGEYMDDIQLIRDNCQQYNQEQHQFVVNANLMLDLIISMISRINKDLLMECEKVAYRATLGLSKQLNRPIEELYKVNLRQVVRSVEHEKEAKAEEELNNQELEYENLDKVDVDHQVAVQNTDLIDEKLDAEELEITSVIEKSETKSERKSDIYEDLDDRSKENLPSDTEFNITRFNKKRILYIMALLLGQSSKFNAEQCERLSRDISCCFNSKANLDTILSMCICSIKSFNE